MVLESVGFYSTVLWILLLCYWLKKCYFAEFTNIMFAFSFCVDGIFLRLQSLTFLQGHTYTTSNTFLVSVFVNVCTFSFYQWLYTSFPFYSTLLFLPLSLLRLSSITILQDYLEICTSDSHLWPHHSSPLLCSVPSRKPLEAMFYYNHKVRQAVSHWRNSVSTRLLICYKGSFNYFIKKYILIKNNFLLIFFPATIILSGQKY